MKITQKKLKPFLDERNLELHQHQTSFINYYFLAVKGAGQWNSQLHYKFHFYNLKSLWEFLMSHPNNNDLNTIWEENEKERERIYGKWDPFTNKCGKVLFTPTGLNTGVFTINK